MILLLMTVHQADSTSVSDSIVSDCPPSDSAVDYDLLTNSG